VLDRQYVKIRSVHYTSTMDQIDEELAMILGIHLLYGEAAD